MYRAFWLDTKSGHAIELKRSFTDVETHMGYVLDKPDAFGLSRQAVEAVPDPPYEISEYPAAITKPLLDRFIKVNVDERYISFTVTDRLGKRHIQAMQGFVVSHRMTHLGVFVAGEPSGRMIARATFDDFFGIDRVAQLRRLVASPAGKFRVGQVWLRRDGVEYRLSRRVTAGWHVKIGRGSGAEEWGFTDRHLHNIVTTEQLRLI